MTSRMKTYEQFLNRAYLLSPEMDEGCKEYDVRVMIQRARGVGCCLKQEIQELSIKLQYIKDDEELAI